MAVQADPQPGYSQCQSVYCAPARICAKSPLPPDCTQGKSLLVVGPAEMASEIKYNLLDEFPELPSLYTSDSSELIPDNMLVEGTAAGLARLEAIWFFVFGVFVCFFCMF